MVNLEFRPLFRSAEDRAANRREQVRKAQRTFRERRDQYLRMLERQVKKLQISEAKLQDETERLQLDLARLNAKLARHGAEIQSLRQSLALNGVDNTEPSSQVHGELGELDMSLHRNKPLPNTVISFEILNGELHQIHVRNGRVGSHSETNHEAVLGSSHKGAAQRSAWEDMGRLDTEAPTQASRPREQSARLMMTNNTVSVSKLDTVVVAVEFVLNVQSLTEYRNFQRLESPCLPHIHGNPNDDNTPQGHVHTASASLLCCAPFDSGASLTKSYNSLEWEAPRPVLQRLFDISAILPLDYWELTPIQAWVQIRQHPDFTKLRMDRLNTLADKLLSHVKCYGFGAVIKQDFLSKSLLEAFV